MNITNIDDKIIKKSHETGRNWKLIAEEYEVEFWMDLHKLNVRQPDIKLRVTDKIPEIIKFIEKIELQGFTKTSKDGSIIFKTSQYENYGKLQKVVLEDSSSADFAMWKAAKPNEPSWDSNWGRGRPGWHIECSTLASLIFGSYLDFHAGGVDLRFPHHENEEAQSCVFHSVSDWVGNWIHTGHLHMKGHNEKMSKSLKNTVSINELLDNYTSDQFRMACLLSHYRSFIEFGPELMTAADAILKKHGSFRDNVRAFVNGLTRACSLDELELTGAFEKCQKEVDQKLKDDFNTAASIGSMCELMSAVSRMINNAPTTSRTSYGTDKAIIQGIANYIDHIFEIFGIGKKEAALMTAENVQLESVVESMVKVRNEIRLKAKTDKNQELFQISDTIRSALKENRIEIKDHGKLSSWNKN